MRRATPEILTVSHEVCSAHTPFPGHPDRPERLRAALEGAAGLTGKAVAPELPDGEVLEAVSRVHDAGLAARLEAACRSAPAVFDSPDNPISTGTYPAALGAVACALEAARNVAEEDAACVWVPVRPPGHHAVRARAMGFCFLNNVAVMAEDMLRRGIAPLAVVDIDAHHGNGTQDHFWHRGDVYYFSVHQYPAFPGSGGGDQVGEGQGRGRTRNVPLAEGTDDDIFCGALALGLEEIERVMTPAAVLVSAGFDGHADDPLSGFRLTEDGYRTAGRLINQLAAGAPVISVLEGGYELDSLRRSVSGYLEGAAGAASS